MGDFGLAHIAERVGAPVAIADVPGLTPDVVETLTASGLERVPVSTLGPPALAEEAIAGSLRSAALEPQDVATVVWTTTTFHQRSWYTADVSFVLDRLGLGHADAIGITLGECGNLGPALRTVCGLVAADDRPVVVVCSDVVHDEAHRLVAPSATVLGDGAVSCIAGREIQQVRVLAIAQVSNHRLRRVDPMNETVRHVRTTAQGVGRAAAAALEQARLAPDDIDRLLLTNQNASIRAMFAAQCGVPAERIWTPTLQSHAHLFAGDLLTGVARLCTQATRTERILAIANGTCTWTAFVLTIGVTA